VELTTQYSPSAPMQDASSRKSKVAIVTGASSGIGLESVKRLAANGYRVVANARRLTTREWHQERIARDYLRTNRLNLRPNSEKPGLDYNTLIFRVTGEPKFSRPKEK